MQRPVGSTGRITTPTRSPLPTWMGAPEGHPADPAVEEELPHPEAQPHDPYPGRSRSRRRSHLGRERSGRERPRLGPVEVEPALGEQPGALLLDDGVAIAQVGD